MQRHLAGPHRRALRITRTRGDGSRPPANHRRRRQQRVATRRERRGQVRRPPVPTGTIAAERFRLHPVVR